MKLSIKHLLVGIVLLSITLTIASSLYAGYRADQQTLKDITLETNSAYAQKLSKVTEEYLLRIQRTLAYSAAGLDISLRTKDKEKLNSEAERLVVQSESLSSVVIVNEKGIIQATSKGVEGLVGEPLRKKASMKTLLTEMPEISEPYISPTGRLIVFISTPIHDNSGKLVGMVGGSIYLSEENVLYKLLGQHFYNDGSYVYVVDQNGMLMYHINPDRVGEVVSNNPVIEALKKGSSGGMQLVNSKNQDMLAGYATIPLTDWGVVSQRPTDKALAPSKQMIAKMIVRALPFLVLSTLLILYMAAKIAKPLQLLASYAKDHQNGEEEKALESGAWYREAIQLESALSDSFSNYKEKVNHFIMESATDPLTGLLNRRALTEQARVLTELKKDFSVILLDIDHFKRVNDTHGHVAGDEVLKYLASKMLQKTGESGTCYRYGGEEFVILLPDVSCKDAVMFTNSLLLEISTEESPIGKPITFSAGVAQKSKHALHFLRLIEIADECLYQAKKTGRNKVVHADEINVS